MRSALFKITLQIEIYGNAYITLCAASSRSCHEGFLSWRGPRIRFPFQSEQRPGLAGVYDVQFKYAARALRIDHRDALAYDLRTSRWANRAWTFQERMLSTRRILFGNSNIHFFCGSLCGSMGGQLLPPYPHHSLSLDSLKTLGPSEIRSLWDGIGSEYGEFNETSLTRPSDILPALAGLAGLFQQRLGDEYICGY